MVLNAGAALLAPAASRTSIRATPDLTVEACRTVALPMALIHSYRRRFVMFSMEPMRRLKMPGSFRTVSSRLTFRVEAHPERRSAMARMGRILTRSPDRGFGRTGLMPGVSPKRFPNSTALKGATRGRAKQTASAVHAAGAPI